MSGIHLNEKSAKSQAIDMEHEGSDTTETFKRATSNLYCKLVMVTGINAILAGAIITVICITWRTSADIITETLSLHYGGIREQETAKSYPAEHLVDFDLQEQGARVVLDYGKRLVSGTVMVDGQQKCFVWTFSDSGIPQLQNYLRSSNSTESSFHKLRFTLERELVSDKSILPASLKKICKDLPLQWAKQVDEDSPKRSKRRAVAHQTIKRPRIAIEQ